MNEIQKKTAISLILAVLLNILFMTDMFGLLEVEESLMSKWLDEIGYCVFFGLLYLTVWKFEKQRLLLWPEKKVKWYFYPFSVTAVFFSAVIIAVTLPIIFNLMNITVEQESLKSAVNYYCKDIFLLIFASLTAGVIEELVFRGFLMPRLELFIKRGWAVVILSSLIFAGGHIASLSIIGVTIPFFIGLVFSFHYYRYRNIKVLILTHFLIDFASFITSC